jgi:hypothetical protein
MYADISALRGDLRDMECGVINRWELFEQGREPEKIHAMESEVELEVPHRLLITLELSSERRQRSLSKNVTSSSLRH